MSKKKTKRDWIYFLKKGEKAFAIGDYENSYDYLSKSIFESINLYPYNSKAYLLRSLINYEWGFLREAKIDLTNAITRKSSPGFYEFYLRGLIYLRFYNLKNAIKDFKKSILLNPNHFESHFNKGACNYDLGNYDSAVLDFNNAYKIKKNDEDLFFNRGIAYFASGNYKKAIIDFDNINNLNNFKRDIFFL